MLEKPQAAELAGEKAERIVAEVGVHKAAECVNAVRQGPQPVADQGERDEAAQAGEGLVLLEDVDAGDLVVVQVQVHERLHLPDALGHLLEAVAGQREERQVGQARNLAGQVGEPVALEVEAADPSKDIQRADLGRQRHEPALPKMHRHGRRLLPRQLDRDLVPRRSRPRRLGGVRLGLIRRDARGRGRGRRFRQVRPSDHDLRLALPHGTASSPGRWRLHVGTCRRAPLIAHAAGVHALQPSFHPTHWQARHHTRAAGKGPSGQGAAGAAGAARAAMHAPSTTNPKGATKHVKNRCLATDDLIVDGRENTFSSADTAGAFHRCG